MFEYVLDNGENEIEWNSNQTTIPTSQKTGERKGMGEGEPSSIMRLSISFGS